MMRLNYKFACAGILSCLLPGPVAAERWTSGQSPPIGAHSHINTPGTINENHDALFFEIGYVADVFANVSGGVDTGTRYLDNLDLVLEADLDTLLGWTGAELHIYGLYNNGTSFSELAGDAQVVSNIEAGTRALRLYEFWIDQQLGDGWSLKTGLYDLNSEFDALDSSGLFIGSAHGIGTDFGQTGENGPSIFPSTSLALRAEKRFKGGLALRAAILDGVPGNPSRPGLTCIDLGGNDGALVVGEAEIPLSNGKLLIGHWRYTARFQSFAGVTEDGNAGLYLRGEAELFDLGEGALSAFFRLGTADGRFNIFDRFLSGGINLSGPNASRPYDAAGLAIAHARTSDGYRAATGAGTDETVIEFTYRAQLGENFALQPDFQYVISPSADPGISDALGVGLRLEFTNSF